ncbi:hypothetical protein PN466_14475 [Roseofilum reptotaenium CS-1145]|uniref:Uncharacterized protein n=1 Tax=Roseofilum reptotaenium AO1-A TaxID=1925591 RepID=A0A1L9QRE7_9CYAN|nr:hypothetical protein [Roseofilum reptotaenium]MDB9518153.1 hypothetical protein [Roseofilum reptotaenium CS-1145]OJJ25275.1 hypothetical protein BI308_12385 [Roseofilum reptotaenium AO1-A]
MSDQIKEIDFDSAHQRKMKIVQSLIERDDIRRDARESFKKAYPNAPECMTEVAIFHVYVDGIGATLDWLVAIENFLRNPDNLIPHSKSSHLLYHIYNWHQFLALLPEGYPKIVELVEDIKAYINDDEIDVALDSIEELEDVLQARLDNPDF